VIVAVVGVVFRDAAEPLHVRAGEPVAERVDARVPTPVVVVGPVLK
jgi:hypothetical protein